MFKINRTIPYPKNLKKKNCVCPFRTNREEEQNCFCNKLKRYFVVPYLKEYRDTTIERNNNLNGLT